MVCFGDARPFGVGWREANTVILSLKADTAPAILELEYFSYLEFPNEECSLTGQAAKAGSTNNEENFCSSCFLRFCLVSAWLTQNSR